MQTIIKIIKYILESNIINFCIMVWLFVWLSKKFDFISAFNKAINNVKDYIEKSENEKESSLKLVTDSEKLIEKLPSDIKKIENFNKQKSETYKKQLEESTEGAIEKIIKDIKEDTIIEEKKASNLILEYSCGESLKKAQNDIIELLKSDPQKHYEFIEKSLEELEKVNI